MKKIFAVGILFFSLDAHGAGYLEFDTHGTPYKWDKTTFDVHIDGVDGNAGTDGLGAYPRTNGVNGSDDLVLEAFDNWANILGVAGPIFQVSTPVGADITYQNLGSFVNLNGTSCPTPDFVVVYDSSNAGTDDQIFSKFFPGQSDSILGFASPSVFNNTTKKISCGYAFINGFAVSSVVSDASNLLYTMMHEFGHAQNLEHSQINDDLLSNSDPSDDKYIPLMFPFIPNDTATALTGGPNMDGIKLDDQFSFLYLYGQTQLNLLGQIQGKILTKTNEGVLGVNVICSGKSNPRSNVVSWLSGSNLDEKGDYVCGNLPDGNYNVKIEPILYAVNSWDDKYPPDVPVEYYNGANESFNSETDSLSEKVDVPSSAGATTNEINIVLNNNGQITSGKKVSGTIEGTTTTLSVADLEYYIYVPKSVTKATFELTSNPSSRDLDLYGKCDSPFSVSSNAPDIYNPSSASGQQADFAGAEDTGNESVTLDSTTTPKLDNCEYHLLVVNYDSSSAKYELTATLEGPEPELQTNFTPTKKILSNGETLVSTVLFEASRDQFTIDSATFTDVGVLPLNNVTKASIYYDENDNGTIDADELTIATTSSINATTKKFAFSKLNIFLDEGQQKSFLLTYTIPSASTLPWYLALPILLLIVTAIMIDRKKSFVLMLAIACVVGLNRCSGSSSLDYNPRIETSEDITALASGFGAQYSVQVGAPKSVKDFFE